MSFRERIRRTFSRSQSDGNSESTLESRSSIPSLTGSDSIDHDSLTIDPRENLTLIQSNATQRRTRLQRIRSAIKKEDPFANWPENIYKPHEIPRSKYRKPVDPAHQAQLTGYSLRNAFAEIKRTRSFLSDYSPFGSRMPSRTNSVSSRIIPSVVPSRSNSVVGTLDEADEEDADDSQQTQRRRRRETVTTASSVPELVTSSSIGSNDTDSELNTSQAVTLNAASRARGLLDGTQDYNKSIDGEELARVLTQRLVIAQD